MSRPTPEERRAKLKSRTQRSSNERDSKSGGSQVLDYSVAGDKKVSAFKPKSGKEKNAIDILPFEVTQEWYQNLKSFSGRPTDIEPGYLDYKLEVPIHYGIGPANEAVLCLREAFGKPCCVCDAMFAEYEKDEPNEKTTNALRSKWRTFYNVYDYDEGEKDLQIWDVSYHLFEKLLMEEVETDDGDDVEDVFDLENGKIILFKGKEKKLGKNEFIEAQSFEFEERDQPYHPDAFMDSFPLDAMFTKFILTPEEVSAIYHGEEASPAQDPLIEEENTSTRQRPQRMRRAPEKHDDIPESVEGEPGTRTEFAGNECPYGGIFGKDCNNMKACATCEDDLFNICSKYETPPQRTREAPPGRTRAPERTREAPPGRTRSRAGAGEQTPPTRQRRKRA